MPIAGAVAKFAAWGAVTLAVCAFGGDLKAAELRLGGGYAPHGPEKGGSITGDVLFDPPRALKVLGSPRPYVGAQLSLDGYTNFAQAGLIWRFEGPRVYFDLGGGLSVHDGNLSLPRPAFGLSPAENERRRREREKRIEWDMRAVFHATFALGLRLGDRWAVELEGQHWSNGELGSDTHDGADSVGLRTAYRF